MRDVGYNSFRTIDKGCLLTMIKEAEILAGLYEQANREDPCSFYDYGCIDSIVLRQFEMKHGVVLGLQLKGMDLKMPVQKGVLTLEGEFIRAGNSRPEIYILAGYRGRKRKEGTTVSRFAMHICSVLERRYENRDFYQAVQLEYIRSLEGVKNIVKSIARS